jgi:predicted transcriptional regulator
MDEILTKKLMELDKVIEKRKQEKSKLQGKLEMLMKSLKEDIGCDTVEEAIEYENFLQDELNNIHNSLETLIEKIENKLKV